MTTEISGTFRFKGQKILQSMRIELPYHINNIYYIEEQFISRVCRFFSMRADKIEFLGIKTIKGNDEING